MKITEGMKKKAMETAAQYDTQQRPAIFTYRGKKYAVSKDDAKYTIYDDADGGNSLYFTELGDFTA